MQNGFVNTPQPLRSTSNREGISKLVMLQALKRNIEEAISSVLSKIILRVKVQDEKDYSQLLNKLNTTLVQATRIIRKEISNKSGEGVNMETLREVRDVLKDANPDYMEIVKSLQDVARAINSMEFPTLSNNDVVEKLTRLERVLSDLPSKFPKPEKVVLPKSEKIDFPSTFSLKESEQIISVLNEVLSAVNKLPKNLPKEKPKEIDLSPLTTQLEKVEKAVKNIPKPQAVEFPTTIDIGNFPPQRIPTPVTSININSLRGPLLSTSVNVTNTATLLPPSALSQRRSLILYNNSSQTLYIGASGVTTANGLPVASGQFSPALDIGDIVELYGIVASGTANIRVLESSMDDQGA